MPLCDYLYVDLPKVISLYSQLTGGIVESRETTQEKTSSSDDKRKYDFKIFTHNAGGTLDDRSEVKETLKPHHAVLAELEEKLRSQGYLVDLSQMPEPVSLRDPGLRQRLSKSLCVRVEGRCVLEDYERIKGIAVAFPNVTKLINQSAESTLKNSDSYKGLLASIAEAKNQAKTIKDRNARAKQEATVRELQSRLDATVLAAVKLGQIDPWLLEGIQHWLNTFLPGIINLRVYPSIDKPDEQVFGHLKRQHFEDPDSSSFHFTYGSVPTERLVLLGIVSSVPVEGEDSFKPMQEFEKEALADNEGMEKAFRNLFRGFDGMEQMIRTCRYPRILVYPLVVYRKVEPSTALVKA